MKVLIACERSQVVCSAFRNAGAEAYSCDILPCQGEHPQWHIQTDVREVLNHGWDMIIAHPPCTYLTITGNAWFNKDRYGYKAIERAFRRYLAFEFVLEIWNAKCEKICIENPVGWLNTHWMKPSQIIQPYWFGEPKAKKTCLWLKGLPPLLPLHEVSVPGKYVEWTDKKGKKKRMQEWFANNKKQREIFFPGVAKAMANQWLNLN